MTKMAGLAKILILSLFCLGAQNSLADENSSLPRDQILQAYKGGELDSVLLYIRDGRAKPIFKDRADSLLAFKCLGVIYASDPARREKGRYYFNLLFNIDPMASITEFYPSETIKAVFREVHEEFVELHPELMVTKKALATSPPPAVEPDANEKPIAPLQAKNPPSKAHLGWWLAGGTLVAAGAGTASYFILADDNNPKVYRIHD
jgi:hypothetical protein